MLMVRGLRKGIANQQYNGFIVEQKPRSMVSEAYKKLRTNIQYSSFDKEIKTIVITSAQAAEGKSTVSGNLALSFAQIDKKVVIIDCDLRKPSIHKNFKISNLAGLSEVITGQVALEEAVQKYSDNLYILPSGKIPPNPSEMLSSSAMAELIEKVRDKYNIAILDSAPLEAVADAQILSAKVDGTVLVIRAQRTNKESVIEAKNFLKKVGANIIGTVLNSVETIKEKNYYYYETSEEPGRLTMK
ncbi:CpsD/CapB family tyrosine-protein kinase [Clostridium beijerinckii]|uniref:CpsD/CapB family tyrosine-protein kinase n=1 Tax=Clostridium beijerinckii TaxID=1520 RepID=UPI00149496EB|nr:CpsD/CapB family tyrosine-protein kinase [Clostridium beijerinckii]NOW02645.1 capsular exopolysaccharide synthesis family protein [Clostridium beijerinckii]NRT70209.1 capsular exopolysaccharide synthesis family protein [Clostridium beijerinckii]NYC04213.1 capsular exopolysaccharide synthesis family protein [Clostridium beijerinckii]